MNAEARILAWLERADFDGTGCRWSQENIAKACGCSRRTVIRATQKLAAEGRIHSFLERRPGCKWPCRVYRVKHWNPHKRAGVLNVLRSIQERRSSECHTERTATAVRAQTLPSAPSPRCLEDQRCGREARCEFCGFRLEAGVCQNCAELAHKLEKASNHLVGAYETINAQGKELARLRRMETDHDESTPLAKMTREVLDFWAETHPKANVNANGARARLVRAAIRLGHTNPKLPCKVHPDDDSKPDKAARCTIADELIEALEFLRLKPFVGSKGRTAVLEAGCREYADLKYALADEKSGAASEAKIEKCRREVWAVRASRTERLHEAYRLAGGVYDELFRVLMAEVTQMPDWSAGSVRNGNGRTG